MVITNKNLLCRKINQLSIIIYLFSQYCLKILLGEKKLNPLDSLMEIGIQLIFKE